MGACEVLRLLTNKTIVPAKHKKPGNPRYKQVKAPKMLAYTRLKDLNNDTQTVKHLKKAPMDN